MQLFMQDMRQRLPRLSRATYAQVTLEKERAGAFTLVATWTVPGIGEHRSYFDKQRVLGRSASLPSLQQRLVKQSCRVHDDFIAEVLQKRGL